MDKLPKSEKIFFTIMLSIFILGFAAMFWKRVKTAEAPRFQRIPSYNGMDIEVDTKTGVMYVINSNGISVMLDENGKPLIWEQQ